MDEEDVFRKLGCGVKFNTKRFKKDAQRFHLISKPQAATEMISRPQLDFFKKPKTNVSINNKRKTSSVNDNDETGMEKRAKLDDVVKLSRKRHRIFVEGFDIPELVSTFDQLKSVYKLNEVMIENITKRMGFENLTAIQMQVIPALMHNREILACAPTGSGKTLAFLVPIVSHILSQRKNLAKKQGQGFASLILSPTRELAEQTVCVCKQLVFSSNENNNNHTKALLNVKFLDKEQTKIFSKVGQAHSKEMDILISTPNSIVYLLEHNPPLISLDDVEWLIVDESDKLFEEGKAGRSFRDQLGKVYASCTNTCIRRAMFSATFAHDVQQWCLLNMENVLQITVGGKNTAVNSVEQELKFVGNEQGKLLALQQILQKGFSPPVLVFVQSKDRAKQLFAELIYDGKNVDTIHADRKPEQRLNAIKSFRKGDTWILICTELMGRGMDFKGVNLVINYDFPSSAVSYIHRIGRTGRAGRSGKAVTFFTDDDKTMLRSIANVIKEAGCEIPEYMLRMKKASKTTLKQQVHNEVKRASIRTAPPDLLKKSKKHKVMKKRKIVENTTNSHETT